MKKSVATTFVTMACALIVMMPKAVYAKTIDKVDTYTEISGTTLVKTQGVSKEAEAAAKQEMSYLPAELTERLQKDGVSIRINDPEMKPMSVSGLWMPGTKVTSMEEGHGKMTIRDTTIEVDASTLFDQQERRELLRMVGMQVNAGAWQHAGIFQLFSENAEGLVNYEKYADIIGSYDDDAAEHVEDTESFFAEAFSICEENPDWAAKNCPDLYEWVQGVIRQYIYG